MVTHNCYCDGCGVFPTVGARFKCRCPDFDLCEACFAAGVTEHMMLCLPIRVQGLELAIPPIASAAVATAAAHDFAVVHPVVSCDGCKGSLCGVRFKSL